MELREDTIWKLIDTYFQDNPQALVRHHIESYNDFFKNGIQQIFKETNPLKLELDYDKDKKVQDFRSKAHMYFGESCIGKEYNQVIKFLIDEVAFNMKLLCISYFADFRIEVLEFIFGKGWSWSVPVGLNGEVWKMVYSTIFFGKIHHLSYYYEVLVPCAGCKGIHPILVQ